MLRCIQTQFNCVQIDASCSLGRARDCSCRLNHPLRSIYKHKPGVKMLSAARQCWERSGWRGGRCRVHCVPIKWAHLLNLFYDYDLRFTRARVHAWYISSSITSGWRRVCNDRDFATLIISCPDWATNKRQIDTLFKLKFGIWVILFLNRSIYDHTGVYRWDEELCSRYNQRCVRGGRTYQLISNVRDGRSTDIKYIESYWWVDRLAFR